MGLLTDLKIRTASASGKEVLLADSEGLYLRIRSSSRNWVYRYKQDGVQIKLGLGSYPAVSLAEARKKARAEADLRAGGIDPKEARRMAAEQERIAKLSSFEVVARAWHAQAKKDREWSDSHANKVMLQMSVHLFPGLGQLPIDRILPTDVVKCLHRIRDRGFLETAQRVRSYAEQIYQHAVDLGILDPGKNFVTKKTGSLPPPRSRHYAAITDPAQLAQLLRDIQAYSGQFVTRCVLRLMPMVFQRPGQIRLADWKDISFTDRIWRCPPENMKLREWQKRDVRTPAHLVPLPTQAIEILRELQPITGPTGPIFRSTARRTDESRFLSDNTINSALRTLGYDTKEQITGHGFRATARTLIRECLGWDKDVIERHLAHVSDEELGGSYDRTTFLAQRREMVQAWADLLDDLAAGKEAPHATAQLRSAAHRAGLPSTADVA
jgi:integrase